MKLQPDLPPGRASRKTLAHTAEIQRLRAHGYTHAAIQRALQALGVFVSLSTVQRETKRPLTARPAAEPRPSLSASNTVLTTPTPPARTTSPPAPAPHPEPGPDPSSTTAPPYTRESLKRDPRSSRDIADAFMKDYVANPLLNRSPR